MIKTQDHGWKHPRPQSGEAVTRQTPNRVLEASRGHSSGIQVDTETGSNLGLSSPCGACLMTVRRAMATTMYIY